MSHSKHTRRGFSYPLDAWGTEAKRYVVGCALCAKKGFNPIALENQSLSHWNKRELQSILDPLELDSAGLCIECQYSLPAIGS